MRSEGTHLQSADTGGELLALRAGNEGRVGESARLILCKGNRCIDVRQVKSDCGERRKIELFLCDQA